MKKTRKLISLIIAVAFILSAFPVPMALAEDATYKEIGLAEEQIVEVNGDEAGRGYFTFTAQKACGYKIFSTGDNIDPRCWVYDSEMNEIASADDDNGWQFVVTLELAVGETIYIDTEVWDDSIYGEYSVYIVEIQEATGISFKETAICAKEGASRTIEVVVSPLGAEVGEIVWESSDESVVSIIDTDITSCEVLFIGKGQATITATAENGMSAICEVTVEDADFILENETVEIVADDANSGVALFKFISEEGGRYTFYSFDNDFDTYGHIYDRDMQEIYSNDDDGEENNFRISFDAEADTVYYFRARPYSSGAEGKYSIKVVKLEVATDIAFSKESISGVVGNTFTNKIIVTPENAEHEEFDFEIDDESVAKVTDIYDNGYSCQLVLTGIGSTTLTATSQTGLSAICEITVGDAAEITVGEKIEEIINGEDFNIAYKFVPEEDGLYKFKEDVTNASYSLHLYDSEFNTLDSNSWMEVELTAGEEYYFSINGERAEAESIELSLEIIYMAQATGIKLSATEIKGLIATYKTIELEFEPENAIIEEITWTSSNEDAVIIYDVWNYGKECEVRIVGAGSSVITATTESGLTASCTVSAENVVEVTTGEEYTRYAEEGYSYTYMFTPEESGIYKFDFTCKNAYIDWSVIYDGDLSWLDDSFDDFQYEFIAGETYYINLSAGEDYYDEGDESYISLTVTKLEEATGIAITPAIEAKEGKHISLEAEFLPENVIKEAVFWESSDESVAIVSDLNGNHNENAEIFLKKEGSATITATTQSGLSATCEITVIGVDEAFEGENSLIRDGDYYTSDDNFFKFIPEEDGVYSFDVIGENIFEVYIQVFSFDGEFLDSGYSGVQVEMEKGKAYFCAASACVECTDDDSSASLLIEKLEAATSIEINCSSIEGVKGQFVDLYAVFGPDGCATEYIEWSIEDETVAQINNTDSEQKRCRILLCGTGTTAITVTSQKGLTASITISVAEAPEITLGQTKVIPESNSLGSTAFKFVAPESGKYTFYSLENDCDTYGYLLDEDLVIIGNDDDSKGNSNFKITFEAEEGSVYYLSSRRYSAMQEGGYSVKLIGFVTPTGLQLSQSTISGKPGEEVILSASLLPNGAELEEEVYWSTSDSTIAAIYYSDEAEDNNSIRNIKLKSEGSATITAYTESGFSANCTVACLPVAEIEEGTTPLIKNDGEYSGKDNVFKIIPDETATYSFSMQSNGTVDEYIEVWSADDSVNEGATGEMELRLHAGVTYYCRASAAVEYVDSYCSLIIKKLIQATSVCVSPDSVQANKGDDILLTLDFYPELSAIEDFSVELSDYDVLSILSCGNDYIWIRAAEEGTATVEITTESGLTTEATITVNPNEEITLDEVKTISVETSNTSRSKIYEFIPEEDGVYTFFSFNNDFDIFAEVYDEFFEYIDGDDDGADNLNFSVSFEAEAGQIYYLKSMPNSDDTVGKYSVSVKKLSKATALRLSRSSYKGLVLSSLLLEAAFLPVNSIAEEVYWSTSDESVAQITYSEEEYAEIVAVGAGTAIITARTEDGLMATCLLTIDDAEEITVGSVLKASYSEGKVEKLYKFIPEESGVYKINFSDKSENGGYSLYEAGDYSSTQSNGTGEFKLEAGKEYYLRFTFWNSSASPTEEFDVTLEKCSKATSMTLSKTELTGKITHCETINAVFGPQGSAYEDIEWQISDESVVELLWADESSAEFRIIGSGVATLTATSENGLTATCTVTGEQAPTIEIGEEISVSSDSNEFYEVYRLEPTETGEYTFYSLESNFTKSEICLYNSYLEWEEMLSYNGDFFSCNMELDEGSVYYLLIRGQTDESTASASMIVSTQVEATGISFAKDAISGSRYESIYVEYGFEPVNSVQENITITSSDSSVVMVDGSFITFVGVGTATITITSESGLTDTCTVTVTEPPVLTLGAITSVSVADSIYNKVFSFTPGVSGIYTFESFGSADVFCRLHDSAFNELKYNDDDGDGYNFLLSYSLEAGRVYYLSTRAYTSHGEAYTFTVVKAVDGDVNGDDEVDVLDYQQVVNYAVSSPDIVIQEQGEQAYEKADINGDGAVDALDAWKLALMINQ